MRTFYIFKIKEEYATLTENNPYHLFRMLNFIHNLDQENIDIGANLFYKMIERFDMEELNKQIYNAYKENLNYTKFKNIHNLNSFLDKEESKLVLHNYFMTLKTSSNKPTFFDNLENIHHLFICDFKNIDYFWLQSIPN